jgi:hypothetical protein
MEKDQDFLELTLALVIQLQAVTETIDELPDNVSFKREMKMRTLNYQNYIDKFINVLGDKIGNINNDESEKILQNYVDAVKDFSDLRKTIRIKQEHR